MTAIVFDLDGTLIESAPDIHRAANVALAGQKKPPLPLALVRTFIGNGVPTLIERVMDASGLQGSDIHAAMVDDFMADYNAAPADLTLCFDGVPQALAELQAQGFKLAICTNKPQATSQAIISQLGLAHLFDVIIGGDSLPYRKPDPRPLLATFHALGEDRGLYVGDSEVDAETAHAAGIPILLFTQGYRAKSVQELNPRASFDSFADLSDLVAEQLQGVTQ